MVASLDTTERRLLPSPEDEVDAFFQPLLDLWHGQHGETGETFPPYAAFDILELPPALVPHLILCELVGSPRRFFYELAGDAIEKHNGFSARKRFLSEVPLQNKRVMAREFGLTVFNACPAYSRGPYIGLFDYIREIERLICPYRIEGETFAFVAVARFTFDERSPVGTTR